MCTNIRIIASISLLNMGNHTSHTNIKSIQYSSDYCFFSVACSYIVLIDLTIMSVQICVVSHKFILCIELRTRTYELVTLQLFSLWVLAQVDKSITVSQGKGSQYNKTVEILRFLPVKQQGEISRFQQNKIFIRASYHTVVVLVRGLMFS